MKWNIAVMQAQNEGTGGIRGILQGIGERLISVIETITGAEQQTTTVYVDRTNPTNVALVLVVVVIGIVAGISLYKILQYRAVIDDLVKESKERREK